MFSAIAQRIQPSTKVFSIHVVQYERDDHGVGSEEHFHWALVLLFGRKLQGPCFQIVDRHFRDGRVEWSISDREVDLQRTSKCLGGVTIGTIKEREIDILRTKVTEHIPTPKSTTWNCRDWVMEIISIMIDSKWVPYEIPDQATLVARLKVASVATKANYDKHIITPELVPFAPESSSS